VPQCKYHKYCDRDVEDDSVDGLCILHSTDPAKDTHAFAEALVIHRERHGDNFARFVFPSRADFAGATFSERAIFDGATFTKEARFSHATFSKGASFRGATFSERAIFDGATFTKEARFSHATFSKGASFRGATFTKEARFLYAAFSEDANFREATFTEGAIFDGATFSKGADFDETTFSKGADFHRATFSKGAIFWKAMFREGAIFWKAMFREGAIFDGATFAESADFDGTTFTREANFREATFREEANFREATFREGAIFWKAMFREGAIFDGAMFSKGAYFNETMFTKEVYFGGAIFAEGASFGGAMFSEGADFTGATFSKGASFRGATFSGRTLFAGRLGSAQAGHIFAGMEVDFRYVVIAPPDVITFLGADLTTCQFLDTDLRKVQLVDVKWPQKGGRILVYDEMASTESEDEDGSARPWSQIERLYRELKQNYEDRRDYERAGDFHYGEKEMRRQNPDTALGLRFFLMLYWLFSGYGERYLRPLLWAGLLFAGSTFGYMWWGLRLKDGSSSLTWTYPWINSWDWLRAAYYSFRVMTFLKPDDWVPLRYAQIINTVQTLLAPFFLGLFALALRQRLKR
jgi:uncharacterized protein YjbI with pentapeptide repeats